MSGSPFGILEMVGADKAADTQAEAATQAGNTQAHAATTAANIAAEAQKYAADLQFKSVQGATDELRRQYDQMSASLQPYVDAGRGGLDKFVQMVNAGPGDYTKSPGYDFRLQQGMDAMQRSASAKGVLNNPQTMKALNEYGQNFATADYDNFLNRYYQSLVPYQSLSTMGQSSAARVGTAGMDMASGIAGLSQANAQNVGNQAMTSAGLQGSLLMSGANAQANALQNAANARATGYINQANVMGGQMGSMGQTGALASMYGGGSAGYGYNVPAGYEGLASNPSAWMYG